MLSLICLHLPTLDLACERTENALSTRMRPGKYSAEMSLCHGTCIQFGSGTHLWMTRCKRKLKKKCFDAPVFSSLRKLSLNLNLQR